MTNSSTDAPTPIDNDAAQHLVSAYDEAAEPAPEAKVASMMTDAFLLRAYDRVGAKAGKPEADALLAEIERRGLNT